MLNQLDRIGKKSKLYLLFFCLSWWATSSYAALNSDPPKINASAWLLVDAKSGTVLTEKNADEKLPPASLTKIMVSYIVAEEIGRGTLKLEEMVDISVNAWRTKGSRMFIREGTQVKLEDLLHGVIIQSGNDATIALAEHIAGSEDTFVSLMNKYAENLGMNNTNFTNASGLPTSEHYSSARDLYKLSSNLIRKFPVNYSIYKKKSFTYGIDVNSGAPIKQNNRNRLLWLDRSVDGIKTGHTNEAGYCIVASAVRNGMRLIAIVLGTNTDKTRNRAVQKLFTYGFRFFETHEIFQALEPQSEIRIWGGDRKSLAVGLQESVILTIPRGDYDNLSSNTIYDKEIWAPIAKGDKLGTITIELDNKLLVKRPLIALNGIKSAGTLERFKDWLSLLINPP